MLRNLTRFPQTVWLALVTLALFSASLATPFALADDD